METILEELNQAVGVTGSMIVTKDGMVVTSRVDEGISEDTMAALVSAAVLSTRKGLDMIDFGDFTQFVLKSSDGKIILQDAGEAFLVVIADMRIKLDVTILDIRNAAYQIGKRLRV